jgi:hypothetical protein
MRIRIIGLFILALHQGVAAAATPDSVVSGRAISNTYLNDVKIGCPKGDICMDAWFRWTIDVEKTLRGPLVTGRVIAVRMQHSAVVPSYERRLRLFTLSRIEDAKQRARLRSDYYLTSTSLAEQIDSRSAPSAAGAAQLPSVRGHTTASAHAVNEILLGISALAATRLKCSHLDSISAGPVPVGFDPRILPQVPATLMSPPRPPIRLENWRITGCGRSESFVVRLWRTSVGKETFVLSPQDSPERVLDQQGRH